MKYGYFEDARREYVITTPKTPFPWINYLGNEEFFGLVSNTGGGYCFHQDAKLRRLTRYRYNNVPLDDGGRYYYISDLTDGDVWSPGWKPLKTELDRYECRHGLSYTAISGTKNGVTAELLVFVPLHTTAETHLLTIRNDSSRGKHLKLHSLTEWCLWNAQDDMTNFQRNLSIGEVEIDGSTLYHKSEYRERRNHYAYYSVNAAIAGFDTDRDAFLGPYNGFDMPAAVAAGTSFNSVAHGWAPIASHFIELELSPGETRELVFVLGYAENPEDEKWESPGVINKTPAKETLAHLDTASKVRRAHEQLLAHWDGLLSVYVAETGDPRLDRMVNTWNQYQCMVTFNMSRSASYFESGIGRGMGFRDSNQDLIGFVHQVPERARTRIRDIAATQRPDGSAYHQYQPLTKRGNDAIGADFNDDPLWLLLSTAEYVKETGDFGFLEEPVPFDHDDSSAAPHIEHLQASLDHALKNVGPHGLPLIGRADWNDCLNLNCFSSDPDEPFQTAQRRTGGTAESVVIAALLILYGREYVELCRRTGRSAEASRAQNRIQQMEENVKRHGWDGEWFIRAYDHYGEPVGAMRNSEGRIYAEAQGLCGMAGIGLDEGLVRSALDATQKHLETANGVLLHQPAYSRYYIQYGEISSYPPGYKENAGIFCHNNPWIMIAETVLGRGDRAFAYYRKISPSFVEERSDVHKVEPYVYCQMIAGSDAPTHGEGKNSWLTGTAAWNYYAMTRHILGIRPHYDGLVVDPCIPPEWTGFQVDRTFRGARYTIAVENPDHVSTGVAQLEVDGEPVGIERGKSQRGRTIPIQDAGGTIQVRAVMG